MPSLQWHLNQVQTIKFRDGYSCIYIINLVFRLHVICIDSALCLQLDMYKAFVIYVAYQL